MKRLRRFSLAFGVAALVVAGIALADKAIILASSTATVMNVCFVPLVDGGVTATVTGNASAADGGFYYEKTVVFPDLVGANRTTGLDALTKGNNAWKNSEGL